MEPDKTAGFSIIELMVVVAIIGTVMGIAGMSVRSFLDRYEAESQVRMMHVDMLRARHIAFQKNRSCFVTVASNSYQITEDTNNSGDPDDGDTPMFPPKQFRYPCRWTGTVILEARGTISKSTGGLVSSSPLAIRFDSAGIDSAYDCISVGPTRLNPGKWNDTKCVPR